MNRARVRATCSNVLWSSFRTITWQGSPWPAPGPERSVIGRTGVWVPTARRISRRATGSQAGARYVRRTRPGVAARAVAAGAHLVARVALDGVDAAVRPDAGDHADVVQHAVAAAVEHHQVAHLGRAAAGRDVAALALRPLLDRRHVADALAVRAHRDPRLLRHPRGEVGAPRAHARSPAVAVRYWAMRGASFEPGGCSATPSSAVAIAAICCAGARVPGEGGRVDRRRPAACRPRGRHRRPELRREVAGAGAAAWRGLQRRGDLAHARDGLLVSREGRDVDGHGAIPAPSAAAPRAA